MSDSVCYLCKNKNNDLIDIVNIRHHREIDLGIENFQRKLYRCNSCGVFFNNHNYDLKTLYFEKYNTSTYGNDLMAGYSFIMNLPDGRSDNKTRVRRVIGYCKANNIFKPVVLDVGSGLCVFGGEMIKQGYECSCIDPSPISIQHALHNVGVKKAVEGTIFDWNIKEKVDLVTFNKVLEHLKFPIPVLKYAKKLLNHGGGIYLELPDGENALKNGTAHEREEFFVEHYTIFNRKSLEYLSKVSGYKILELEQIHEPSDKYTLCVFLSPA